MSQELRGGCACSRVRYRLRERPMFVHCCHCQDCQRRSGGPFALNAMIETTQVEVLAGEPVAIGGYTDSGRSHRVFHCPDCETALFSEYCGIDALRFVRAGTLDEPSALQPDVHIYPRSQTPWIRVPDEATSFADYYDSDAVRQPEDQDRRRAILN